MLAYELASQFQTSWMTVICDELRWLVARTPMLDRMPDPAESPSDWYTVVSQYCSVFRTCISNACDVDIIEYVSSPVSAQPRPVGAHHCPECGSSHASA